MVESTDRWTEEMLAALEPHEHDFQEFKGSAWLTDDREDQPRSTFALALSKQVSAFVNGAGGRLFIGVADDGTVDGGVPVDLKGGGTLRRAFTYKWRLWTIPEIREVLAEAGFREVTVYWEGTDEDGDGNGVFRPTRKGDDSACWVVYITARP